jgi:DNA-binding transcriptional MerR regulator
MDANSPSHTPVAVDLPPIPAKRYFTIGEVSELCGVKPHVLRYWEQEFTQLKSVVKRRGNRRYYQHHEVLLVRRIRDLLYSQRFTISGARSQLEEELLQAGGLMKEEGGGGASEQPLSIAQIHAELAAILKILDAQTILAPSELKAPPPEAVVSSPVSGVNAESVTRELFSDSCQGTLPQIAHAD